MTSPFTDDTISLFKLLRVYPAKQQIQRYLSQRFSPELAVMWMRYTEIRSNVGRKFVVVTPFDYDPGLAQNGYENSIDWCTTQLPYAEKSYLDFCQTKEIDPEEVETAIQEFVEQQITSNRALT